jgi:hypothetical protein
MLLQKPLFEWVGKKMRIFFFASLFLFFVATLVFTFTFFSDTNVVHAKASSWTPPSGKELLEVHIANDGTILLRGAKVISVSETGLVVGMAWDKTEFTWKVSTNARQYDRRHFGTDLFNSKGARIPLTDIQVGDVILVSGILDTNAAEFSIKADTIRTSH